MAKHVWEAIAMPLGNLLTVLTVILEEAMAFPIGLYLTETRTC